LDQFVEQVLLPTYNYGDRRRPNPPYMTLLHAARKRRTVGKHGAARKLRRQAQQMPSRDPDDPNFRRLWYVRYADDWLLGYSGPRSEAEQIKIQLSEFLRDELKLELSQEKTLITNARTEAARFLGYEVINQNADDIQCRRANRRCINGASGLKIPVEVIRKKCSKFMKHGKPTHRAEMLSDTDFSIISRYQAEYRGVVQYYLRAYNVHRLNQLYHVMKLSLARTLAAKHRLSANKVMRKYQTMVSSPHGKLKAMQVVIHRSENKKPLVAQFGGIELRRQKSAVINDRPPEVYNTLRSEILQRLLADQCELCGSEDNCEAHHVRKLADIDRPGQKEKPSWVKRMIARRRKTLVVCRKCHGEIHQGKLSGRKLPV
jgi:AI2M/AI1M-like, HNH endonuclease/Type II intron maturase